MNSWQTNFNGNDQPLSNIWDGKPFFLEEVSTPLGPYRPTLDNQENIVRYGDGTLSCPNILENQNDHNTRGNKEDYNANNDSDAPLLKGGFETIAWYRSYHWLPKEKWGIYVIEKGFRCVVSWFHGNRQRFLASFTDSAHLVWDLVIAHELFHYQTDLIATLCESTQNAPFYLRYLNNTYLPEMSPRSDCWPLEEALANSYAFRIGRQKAEERTIIHLLNRQPPGYCRWGLYVDKQMHRAGRFYLTECIVDARIAASLDWDGLLETTEHYDKEFCNWVGNLGIVAEFAASPSGPGDPRLVPLYIVRDGTIFDI